MSSSPPTAGSEHHAEDVNTVDAGPAASGRSCGRVPEQCVRHSPEVQPQSETRLWISCVMSGELAVVAPAGETYTRIVHPPRVDLTAVMRYPFSPNRIALPGIPKISGEHQSRPSLLAPFDEQLLERCQQPGNGTRLCNDRVSASYKASHHFRPCQRDSARSVPHPVQAFQQPQRVGCLPQLAAT